MNSIEKTCTIISFALSGKKVLLYDPSTTFEFQTFILFVVEVAVAVLCWAVWSHEKEYTTNNRKANPLICWLIKYDNPTDPSCIQVEEHWFSKTLRTELENDSFKKGVLCFMCLNRSWQVECNYKRTISFGRPGGAFFRFILVIRKSRVSTFRI